MWLAAAQHCYVTKHWGVLPVDASVVVVPIEELDLLKGLLAGVVTGQVRVHAKEQVERRRPWEAKESGVDKTKRGRKEQVSESPVTVTPSKQITICSTASEAKNQNLIQTCMTRLLLWAEWWTSDVIISTFLLQGVLKHCVSPVFWGPMTSSLGKRSHVFSLDQMSLCLLSSQGSCSHKKINKPFVWNVVPRKFKHVKTKTQQKAGYPLLIRHYS